MAISREKKEQIIKQYEAWLNNSQSTIVAEYTGLNMHDFDELRSKVREAGGEFHVMKNTLAKIAFKNTGVEFSDEIFTGSTAVAFAFEDPPALAKAIVDFAKRNEFLKVKCGYLGKQQVSAAEVTALAELPPLPVLRAQLLGTLMAPATKLARILAEPGRQIASVLKAYSEKDAAPEAA